MFLERAKMNTKSLNNNQAYILTLFVRCFRSVLICVYLWPKSFLCVLYDLHGINEKIRENLRNPWIKKMKNEPNFNESDITVSNCYRSGYNAFSPENPKQNEPKRTQLNPIKPIFYYLLSTALLSRAKGPQPNYLLSTFYLLLSRAKGPPTFNPF